MLIQTRNANAKKVECRSRRTCSSMMLFLVRFLCFSQDVDQTVVALIHLCPCVQGNSQLNSAGPPNRRTRLHRRIRLSSRAKAATFASVEELVFFIYRMEHELIFHCASALHVRERTQAHTKFPAKPATQRWVTARTRALGCPLGAAGHHEHSGLFALVPPSPPCSTFAP